MNERREICPTDIVNAPVETVWALLTEPAGWGDFFDVRIMRVEPAGSAAVGQKIVATSGHWRLRFELTFEFTGIEADRHQMSVTVRLPLGMVVREALDCIPLGAVRCRVQYRCGFSFGRGFTGALARALMRREIDTGPAKSLARLKNAAERRYADAGGGLDD